MSLYLIEILHQTTTWSAVTCGSAKLYLIEILHQTTTIVVAIQFRLKLYLIEILHQTTTLPPVAYDPLRCILSKFYIKPQLETMPHPSRYVVSYRNSTSNHNSAGARRAESLVVSYRNSTSNHNSGLILIDKVLLTGCLPL